MSNQQLQNRPPIYCRNNCGIEITFDSRKSKSGKSIPIDKSSGMPHQCPKKQYSHTQTDTTTTTEVKQDILAEILYNIKIMREDIKKLAEKEH